MTYFEVLSDEEKIEVHQLLQNLASQENHHARALMMQTWDVVEHLARRDEAKRHLPSAFLHDALTAASGDKRRELLSPLNVALRNRDDILPKILANALAYGEDAQATHWPETNGLLSDFLQTQSFPTDSNRRVVDWALTHESPEQIVDLLRLLNGYSSNGLHEYATSQLIKRMETTEHDPVIGAYLLSEAPQPSHPAQAREHVQYLSTHHDWLNADQIAILKSAAGQHAWQELTSSTEARQGFVMKKTGMEIDPETNSEKEGTGQWQIHAESLPKLVELAQQHQEKSRHAVQSAIAEYTEARKPGGAVRG